MATIAQMRLHPSRGPDVVWGSGYQTDAATVTHPRSGRAGSTRIGSRPLTASTATRVSAASRAAVVSGERVVRVAPKLMAGARRGGRERGTQNRYAFAGGNPVNTIEWDGHYQCPGELIDRLGAKDPKRPCPGGGKPRGVVHDATGAPVGPARKGSSRSSYPTAGGAERGGADRPSLHAFVAPPARPEERCLPILGCGAVSQAARGFAGELTSTAEGVGRLATCSALPGVSLAFSTCRDLVNPLVVVPAVWGAVKDTWSACTSGRAEDVGRCLGVAVEIVATRGAARALKRSGASRRPGSDGHGTPRTDDDGLLTPGPHATRGLDDAGRVGLNGKPIWTSGSQGGVRNAFRNFRDHGAEFGAQNALDYVRQTHRFLDSPPSSTLTRVRTNGDVVRYDPVSNTFGGMDKYGAPRTMFKPDPAKHGYPTNRDYFNAQ